MSKRNKILVSALAGVGVLIIAIALIFIFTKKEEVITYTVSFDSDGGTVIEDKIVNEGEKVERPNDPTKDGFIFVEWLLDGETFDFGSAITKDIKLKASWVKLEEDVEMFIVKFDTDGGTTIANQVIEKGKKVEKPVDPKKDEHIFKGWFVDSNEYNFDSEVVSDIVITAKWEKEKKEEPKNESSDKNNTTNNNNNNNNQSGNSTTEKKFTVTFDSKGGSGVPSQSVKSGDKASKPGNPSRDGYTFAGWKLNGKTYDFNSKVTSNITLVASWTENPKVYYTVSFDSAGGTSFSSQSVLAGSQASNPGSPSKEGHTFDGWKLNGNSYNFGSAVNGNITLVASWKQKNYTIAATRVDNLSLDYELSVKENGGVIPVSAIYYSDGRTLLCNGNNTTVSHDDIAGQSSFVVVLSGGTRVNATME